MTSFSLEALIGDIERQATSPLERLGAAVSTSDEAQAVCDDLVGRFVDDARRAGCSWSEIGGVLGVSKQGAQQRFHSPGAEPWPPAFREDAQRALARAGEHAQRLGHPYLGTAHVLLALVEQDDSVAGQVLADLETTPSAVEQAIDRLAARGSPSAGTIGVSGRVKRALHQARREGQRLGHRCPGAEHLLLVLAADEDGIASRVLLELGVTPTRLRDALAARLGPDADEIVSRLTRPRGRLRRRR